MSSTLRDLAPALVLVVLAVVVAGSLLLAFAGRSSYRGPAACEGRIVIVHPARGGPLECVCEAGTLSPCFIPGP